MRIGVASSFGRSVPSHQRTKRRRARRLSGLPPSPAPIRDHGDRPPHWVDRRLHDIEAHRPDSCEALDLESGLDALNHVARGEEGRTPRHHIVNEHDSFEIGSEVTPPPKRSTEGGDGWPLTARGTMCLWHRLGPYEKLLDFAPQSVLVKDTGQAESWPEGVFRPPRRATRNGHQGCVGSEHAPEGCRLTLLAQSGDALKDIGAGILHPTHDLSRPDADPLHIPVSRRVD